MKAKDIKKLAEDLRENYNTRNPFELAEKYGIRVVVSKMLPIDRKAYTIRSDNYPTIIIINGRYEHKSQLVLCAHELGHALLHSDDINNFAVTSKNAFKNVEYEANLFAVSLLFNESDFNMKVLNMSNYLLKQVLDYNIAVESKGIYMYEVMSKKLLVINILDILNKYSDAEHRLKQKDFIDILRKEYGMEVDRKAVRRNLSYLLECGYDIEYTEQIRTKKNGEQETIYTDWYIERTFSNSELRLLIDSLLFSKSIPYKQCTELIEKLESLSNCYFKSSVKHICNLQENPLVNKQLFYNIEILDEAISKGKQVKFRYNYYDMDYKLHNRCNSEGAPREYIINPYQMVATNGRYYLICNYDKYDNYANYRIDWITDIVLLDTKRKPMKKVKGLENGLNLSKHMADHIYMFSGDSGIVRFRAYRYIISELLDWFGKDIKFADYSEDEVMVTVHANLMAMRCFATQYARHITIISPENLVEQVVDDLRQALKRYE